MDRIEVTIGDIEEAVPVVQKVARRTPTIPLEGPEGEVWLKLENLQRLGVFKIRGAWNRISRLTQEERRRGVTTLSSGNHGRAVAWSARRLGLRCVIRVPEGAAPQKLDAIRAYVAAAKRRVFGRRSSRFHAPSWSVSTRRKRGGRGPRPTFRRSRTR